MQSNQHIKILAIETSCDETAAAVIGVENDAPVILSSIVSSQIDLHAKTGGVVPEVASRAHAESIIPVVAEALLAAKKAVIPSEAEESFTGSDSQDLSTAFHSARDDNKDAIQFLKKEIDYIAVTAGPGLIGSLLVGFNAAKTIAYALKKPIIPVNHIEGHIYSAFAEQFPISNFQFPILTLTVSGGHSSLTLMKDHGVYENLGQTIDDAAGEAFDKVAQLLGLGYPGGPAVSKLASQFRDKLKVESEKLKGKGSQLDNFKTCNLITELVFPRPILNDGTLNFSFSGLKTAVLVQVKKMTADGHELIEEEKQEICAAFEDALVDVLVTKTVRAAQKYEPKAIILAGGVAANEFLRNSLEYRIKNLEFSTEFLPAPRKLCGDNAAMIGLAAYYHIQKGDVTDWDKIEVDSNMKL